ncbi:MAG: ABC transporter permease [Prevotellaceae bacterium]|jgi:ABC-2 type transport system permease protein|nr:ABC transporter permease [Prevotellaceae bacterium]
MKKLIGFVQKEFRHIFRDRRTLLIIIGMPFAQVLIFGFAISTDVRHAPVAVLDYSRDVETERLADKIFSSGYFRFAGTLPNADAIEPAFRQGKARMVVVFGNDFARQREAGQALPLQVVADASDANIARLLTGYMQAIVADYLQSASPPQRGVAPETKMLYNPEMRSAYMFVPGVICLLLMLLSCIMTSVSIAREKESGTMEALLASPLRPVQIIFGKVIPYVAIAFVIGLSILALGYSVFRLPMTGNMALLLGECLLYITLSLSIGLLISTIVRTQQTALMVSMFAMLLPAILLSGFIYPIENMPAPLQWLSAVMPPRWFVVIIKNIMLKDAHLIHVWKETLILSGMAAFFLVVSIRNFERRTKLMNNEQ